MQRMFWKILRSSFEQEKVEIQQGKWLPVLLNGSPVNAKCY